MRITTYDATGCFLQAMIVQDQDEADLNVPEGGGYVEGHHDPERMRFSQGVVVPYPPRPHPSCTFDYASGTWIDLRTPAERQAEIYAVREKATLDKSELLMRLAMPGVGILSPEEAIEAAQGRIPESFQPAIASLPVEAQMLARIKWAGDQIISRTNPLLILAAYAKGISDEQMDQIFGVVAPV